jgi:hypothetical protein
VKACAPSKPGMSVDKNSMWMIATCGQQSSIWIQKRIIASAFYVVAVLDRRGLRRRTVMLADAPPLWRRFAGKILEIVVSDFTVRVRREPVDDQVRGRG